MLVLSSARTLSAPLGAMSSRQQAMHTNVVSWCEGLRVYRNKCLVDTSVSPWWCLRNDSGLSFSNSISHHVSLEVTLQGTRDLWALLFLVEHTKKRKRSKTHPSFVHYLDEVCILCNRRKVCGKDIPLKAPLPLRFKLEHLRRRGKPPAKPDIGTTRTRAECKQISVAKPTSATSCSCAARDGNIVDVSPTPKKLPIAAARAMPGKVRMSSFWHVSSRCRGFMRRDAEWCLIEHCICLLL